MIEEKSLKERGEALLQSFRQSRERLAEQNDKLRAVVEHIRQGKRVIIAQPQEGTSDAGTPANQLVYFQLNTEDVAALEHLKAEGESLNQAAKRVFLEFLRTK